jgi:hypothetical protein
MSVTLTRILTVVVTAIKIVVFLTTYSPLPELIMPIIAELAELDFFILC